MNSLDLKQTMKAFASSHLFNGADRWQIDDNPWYRPLNDSFIDDVDFKCPLRPSEQSSSVALNAHRMLMSIYETEACFLPLGNFIDKKADFDHFYCPERKSMADQIRPCLEHFLFDGIEASIQLDKHWDTNRLDSYFNDLVNSQDHSNGGIPVALSNSLDKAHGAKFFCIQFASDALTEASAMARTVIGDYGPIQSDLFKIMIDEYGYGVYATKHSTLFKRLLKNMGLENNSHAYWQFYLPTSLGLVNYFHLISRNHRYFFRYIGALLYVETTSNGFCGAISQSLKKCLGKDADTLYFDEHVHIDIHHGRMMLEKVVHPMIQQCGEEIIPDIVLGIEQYRALGELSATDFADQIAWLDTVVTESAAPSCYSDSRQPSVLHKKNQSLCTNTCSDDQHLYVQSGILEVRMSQSKTIKVQPGQSIFIPKYRLHGLAAETEEVQFNLSQTG